VNQFTSPTVKTSMTVNARIHARVAVMIAKEADKYESKITLKCGERAADAKSFLNLLMLGVTAGSTVEIIVQGSDEDEALSGMSEVLARLQDVQI